MQNMKTAGKSTCLTHTSVCMEENKIQISEWENTGDQLSGRSGMRLSGMLFSNKHAETSQTFVYFHTKSSLQTASNKGR